jgi:UDP:flavonoid glycosyltransferase YjiC (YdhE family)
MSIGSVSHSVLFPRVRLIVHHGGAGTTATALRSGVPQLIVPHIVDQFFHGHRIAELGVGPAPIPKTKFNARGLSRAIRAARACEPAAKRVAAALVGKSGAAPLADVVESLAGAVERARA